MKEAIKNICYSMEKKKIISWNNLLVINFKSCTIKDRKLEIMSKRRLLIRHFRFFQDRIRINKFFKSNFFSI